MRGRRSIGLASVLFALALAAWLGGLGPGTVSPVGALTASTTSIAIHNIKHTTITSAPLGSTVHPFVSVTGTGGPPTGSVVVAIYAGGTCANTAVATSSATALSSGSVDMTGFTLSPGATGAISFKASYKGSATFGASSACTALTVTKATPSIAFELHDGAHTVITSAFIAQQVHVKATITGAAGTVTGTATVRVHQGLDCTGSVLLTRTIDVPAGTGESANFAFDTAAGRSIDLVYNGDTHYNARTSACKQVIWNKLTPGMKIFLHLADHTAVTSVVVGTGVHPSVTMTGKLGAPTGTVDITFFDVEGCTGGGSSLSNVALTSGVLDNAASSFKQSVVGPRSMRIHYDGDANYAIREVCLDYSVTKASQVIGLSVHTAAHAISHSIVEGTPIHPFLTLKGVLGVPEPTGQADFFYHGNGGCSSSPTQKQLNLTIGGSQTEATSFTVTPDAGLTAFSVHYLGDANYLPLEDCIEFTILASPTPAPTKEPTFPPSSTPRPTQPPGATTPPGSTAAPAPTLGPGATSAPSASLAPGETNAPDASAEASAAASAAAGASTDPNASADPAGSQGPGDSAVPGGSNQPGTSLSPSASPPTGFEPGASLAGVPIWVAIMLAGVVLLVVLGLRAGRRNPSAPSSE